MSKLRSLGSCVYWRRRRRERRGPAGLVLSSSGWHLRGGLAGLGAAVGLDDVLDGAAADGAAGVQGLLEAQAAGVAEAHVTARVDDCVHRVLIANGALLTPLAHGRGHWRLRQALRRVGGCPTSRVAQRSGAVHAEQGVREAAVQGTG